MQYIYIWGGVDTDGAMLMPVPTPSQAVIRTLLSAALFLLQVYRVSN